MTYLLLSIIYTAFNCSFYPGNFKTALQPLSPAYDSFKSTIEDGLFESDEVLDIKLTGNLRELLNDRGEKVQKHQLVVSYTSTGGNIVSLPAEARTRGHFRKTSGNCLYPPLLLQFSKTESFKSSLFKNQLKLKLVMPCQGDEYILREWMIYRMYNLITAKSFKSRLVRVQLDDVKKKKNAAPFYGILLEEELQMAKRNRAVLIDKKQIKPEQTEVKNFLTMAVFEYLIGNTDWSVQYQQNVKILLEDSAAFPITVPYDFDHSGLVNAPYAKPAEQLLLYSVVDRRYRGYCVTDMKQFAEVISVYKKLKKDIYDLYSNCPLLDPKYVKATKKYLDEFYVTINNNKAMVKEFSYPCDPNGTGNVVIKGLAKD